MKLNLLLPAVLFLIFSSCANLEKKNYASLPDDQLKKVADSLAQEFIITDGHVDLPYRLKVKHFKLEREYLGIPLKNG